MWITQFTGLFCVLNGNGQVVTWKLTKNMTFNNVEDQLLSLQERLKVQGKNLSFLLTTAALGVTNFSKYLEQI